METVLAKTHTGPVYQTGRSRTPTEGDVIIQPRLPRELAVSLQDEEFILCHILPPRRMSTAENPRVDRESFNPRYYVGDLLDLLYRAFSK